MSNIQLPLASANLPDEHYEHFDKGWHDHYWNPWKQHVAGKTITPANM